MTATADEVWSMFRRKKVDEEARREMEAAKIKAETDRLFDKQNDVLDQIEALVRETRGSVQRLVEKKWRSSGATNMET